MPAAAVIPAPIAYIKVVAVKKLVVGSWDMNDGSGFIRVLIVQSSCLGILRVFLTEVRGATQYFYFEQNHVLKAGVRLEDISME